MQALAKELCERWAATLWPLCWRDRIRFLGDVHDQLTDDLRSFETVATVFPDFVAQLIRRWGTPPIVCREQAHIYACSSDLAHRDAAGLWLKRTPENERTREVNEAPSERRAAPRRAVNKSVRMLLDDRELVCELLNISATGALLDPPWPIALGEEIAIDLPEFGPLLANVVRHVGTKVGVQFAAEISI
jgi:hypothetical protein